MRRDLWLKQWCTDCCKRKVFKGQTPSNQHTFTQENFQSQMCLDSDTMITLEAYSHSQTYKCTQVYMHAHAHIHSICRAFVCMLSCSTFEYNFLYWHCWRELSKQLSQPLLWLRSVHWAVGWRKQLKESQSPLAGLSAFWRGVWQWNTALIIRRLSSKKLSWPETATKSTFLTTAAECLPLSLLLLCQRFVFLW